MDGYSPHKNVLDVTDCRGYRITCSEETCYGKILPARPTLQNRLNNIEEAIRLPHFMCEDVIKKNRNAYYLIRPKGENRYLKVVVELNPKTKKGILITAYFTDKGKEGERIIWTR